MARVFFISTVNGRSKKKEEKKPILRCASSGHNKQTWAIYFYAFDIYELNLTKLLQVFETECSTVEEEECYTKYEEKCEPTYKVCFTQ